VGVPEGVPEGVSVGVTVGADESVGAAEVVGGGTASGDLEDFRVFPEAFVDFDETGATEEVSLEVGVVEGESLGALVDFEAIVDAASSATR
jgi:hypothetical protein